VLFLTGKSYENHFLDQYNEKAYNKIELPFSFDSTVFPTTAIGDTVEISRELHSKWRHQVNVREMNRIRKKHQIKLRNDGREMQHISGYYF